MLKVLVDVVDVVDVLNENVRKGRQRMVLLHNAVNHKMWSTTYIFSHWRDTKWKELPLLPRENVTIITYQFKQYEINHSWAAKVF